MTSNLKNTTTGIEDTLVGKVKEEIGELTGNPELSGVGTVEKNLGHKELSSENQYPENTIRQRKSEPDTDEPEVEDAQGQPIDINRASEYAEGAGTKVAGVIESVVGSIIGDESLKGQGEGKKIEGELQMRNA
ncbi:hypothetical protein K7432_010997 [Basidiobolus ranarum]|uniref:CsbD-like domain-containing protein n=1 Tax=Basidiobolus ranarum TaxID=34480 RepID=A0ABR2WN08_9FUNG